MEEFDIYDEKPERDVIISHRGYEHIAKIASRFNCIVANVIGFCGELRIKICGEPGNIEKLFESHLQWVYNGGMWPQIVSWIVGAVFAVIAWALKLVEFGEPVWLGVVALAVVVGLSSNGVYDIPAIKAFVDKWFGRDKYIASLK